MRIGGRGKFAGQWHVDAEYVVLRIDRADDDAFWLEVVLTAEELEAVLARHKLAAQEYLADETVELDAPMTDAELDRTPDGWDSVEGGAS
jgi:hypothetical protein